MYLQKINLKNKYALVTGAGKGLGRACSIALAEAGATIIALSRTQSDLDKLEKEIKKIKGKVIKINCDVMNYEDLKKSLNKIKIIDILVNNAGAAWGAPFDEFPENGWDKVMDTNVKSIFFLSQKFVNILENSATNEDPSRIINIGSIDGIGIPRADTYSYPASKAAVHHLTRVLANRLANRNINVNAIAPGPFQSNMMASTLKEYGDQIKSSVPRGRIGSPEDIAGTSIFLSSRASAYITGTIIPVDGGSLVARRNMD